MLARVRIWSFACLILVDVLLWSHYLYSDVRLRAQAPEFLRSVSAQASFLIENCPHDVDCRLARTEIIRAFERYDRISGLRFIEKNSGNADIRLRWDTENAYGDSFDNHPIAVSYDYWTRGSRIIFNSKVPWVISADPDQGYDIYTIALHEIGHSLGLEHTPDENSIMFELYLGNRDLSPEDIGNIRSLYGRNR